MRGKLWLYLSCFLGFNYATYVLWAKFAKLVGSLPPIKLGETGEFLLFAAAIFALTLHIILTERRTANEPPPSA